MKFGKILFFLSSLLLALAIYTGIELLRYDRHIQKCKQYAVECSQNDKKYPDSYICPKNNTDCKNDLTKKNPNSCLCTLYNLLEPKLLVYNVKANHKNLTFIRPAPINSYIVPTLALEKADAFFGYGIWKDMVFEEVIADLYKKNTYTYDCGIPNFDVKSPYIKFESECIGTDKFVLEMQTSLGKIHTLGEKLKELNLENKTIFIKMDIAGAEAEIIPDLAKYSKNITGMTIVIRAEELKQISALTELLPLLEKDFILIYRNLLFAESSNGYKCKYSDVNHAIPIALTYINKNLVDEKYLPFKQSCDDTEKYSSPLGIKTFMPHYTINWRIVLYEKIKKRFHKKIDI